MNEIDENELDWKPDLRHPLLMSNKICILLCGAPGSGKSTYGNHLLKTMPNSNLISPDLIRAEFGDIADQSKNGLIFNTIIPARIVGANSQSKDILFDATNVNRKNRANIIAQIKELGYRLEIHVMNTPIEVCKARNLARERKVPDSVIDRMFAQFQHPSLDEGFDKIVYIEMDWHKNV